MMHIINQESLSLVTWFMFKILWNYPVNFWNYQGLYFTQYLSITVISFHFKVEEPNLIFHTHV